MLTPTRPLLTAAELGVSASTWRHTRTGRRPIRYRVAAAVMAHYPKLRQLAFDALAERRGDCGEAA